MWLEFLCPVNQHLKSTIKKKWPTDLCTPLEFLKKMCLPCLIIIQSFYFDYRINKNFKYSHCVICFSCSVHRLFNLYYPQMSKVGKSIHIWIAWPRGKIFVLMIWDFAQVKVLELAKIGSILTFFTCWNNLPPHIKELETLSLFRSNLISIIIRSLKII